MGDDIGSGLLSMDVCFDFCSSNIVQLSNLNLYFYLFRCHHPLITQLNKTLWTDQNKLKTFVKFQALHFKNWLLHDPMNVKIKIKQYLEKLLSKKFHSPCWSALDFWKINLEKSSLTNWIFSLFRTGFLSSPIECVAFERLELLRTEIHPRWSKLF